LAKVVCAVLVLFLLTSVADAAVRVSFIQPEKYHDEDFRSSSRRDGITAEFRKYFEKLGARYLKGNQMLSIDVLDIDLAGQYEPWRPQWSHVRIFRDTTPPRVRLRYTLSQRGQGSHERRGGGDRYELSVESFGQKFIRPFSL